VGSAHPTATNLNEKMLPTEYQRFPKSWQCVPFLEAFKDKTGGNAKIQTGDYLTEGDIPIVDQGQGLYGGFTTNKENICNVSLPCILFGDHTKIFKIIYEPFALGADGVKVLQHRDDIDPKFAYHYLTTLKLPDVGYSRHFRFLKRTFFPIPPIGEQRRIAAILDQADAIRRKRQEAIRLTEELLRATFLDMFGDPVTNPKGWDVKNFGSLIMSKNSSRIPLKQSDRAKRQGIYPYSKYRTKVVGSEKSQHHWMEKD